VDEGEDVEVIGNYDSLENNERIKINKIQKVKVR